MKDLRDTMVIARRELYERAKSKWFVAMTILGPLFMVAMIVVPALIAGSGVHGAKIDIVDQTGRLGPELLTQLKLRGIDAKLVDPATPDEAELARIRDNQINGFFTIPRGALEDRSGLDLLIAMLLGNRSGQILYRGDNGSNQNVQLALHRAVRDAVLQVRAHDMKLTGDQLQALMADVDFDAQHSTGEAAGSSGIGAFLIAYILAFILYMVITLYGVAVMRAVVQEKASRVMELLVAAVKPRSLMAGKILGVGAAGLIQVTVWLAMGALSLAYRDTLLGWFGVDGGSSGLPPFALVEVAVVLVFFVFGFFFYAAMYAAVGAMVSSEQDTQQVQMPVTMLLVVGVLCLQVVSNDPRGSAAATMTMIPLWSPILMPMRFVLGGASFGEVVLSFAILLASTLLVVRAAAKIYRVGVLMYGKRPTLRELFRWLRY